MDLITGIILIAVMVLANISAIAVITKWDELKENTLSNIPVVTSVGILTYMTYDIAFINTTGMAHLATVAVPAALLLVLKVKGLYDRCDFHKLPLLIAEGYIYLIISLWVLARFHHHLVSVLG